MENPATWGPAEKVIDAAIENHDHLVRTNPGFCGLSLTRQIADALREAGLLVEDHGQGRTSADHP